MKNYTNINQIEKEIKNLVTSKSVSFCNDVIKINYYGGTLKSDVLKELDSLKTVFSNCAIKGRKFFSIEIPYFFISDEEKVKNNLYGFSFKA